MDGDEMFDMNGYVYLVDDISVDIMPILEGLNLSRYSTVIISVMPNELWEGLQEEGNQ